MLKIKDYQDKGLFENKALNLELESGYILGVVGANGSGKTQFLEGIRFNPPFSSGEITLDGVKNLREVSTDIPSVFPFDSSDKLELRYKISQIETLLSLAKPEFSKERFRSYLERYELNRNTSIKKLSLGQRQRLMIAIAFASQSKLIVMDEPTEGIDPFILDEILEDLRAYVINHDAYCIIATHQTKSYDQFFDQILYIEDHEILFNLTYPDFLEEANNYLDEKIENMDLYQFSYQRQKEKMYDSNQ